jgi:hypothetical protein
VSEHPWYKDLVYYLQNQICPDSLDTHQKRRLHLESARYIIIGDFLFRSSVDGMLLHCVNNEEAQKLLQETHGSSNSVILGGHFFAKTTTFNIIRKGYYWPSIFHCHTPTPGIRIFRFSYGPGTPFMVPNLGGQGTSPTSWSWIVLNYVELEQLFDSLLDSHEQSTGPLHCAQASTPRDHDCDRRLILTARRISRLQNFRCKAPQLLQLPSFKRA